MRKFFAIAAFAFAFLIQSVVLAAAVNNINWNNAPKIGSRAELAAYLKNCIRNLQTEVPVILAGELRDEEDKFFTSAYLNSDLLAYRIQCTVFKEGAKKSRALYQLEYYPGTKVIHAYRTNNPSLLTADEKRLYNLAVQIVNEAMRQPTILRRELFIHDAITSRATYYSDAKRMTTDKAMPRFVTAIGALLDGRANCQGYSDAFYMLGNMCGFNVGKINGSTHGDTSGAQTENHMWNTIKFDNGKTYFVDVTWDDDSFKFSKKLGYNSYIYFNAPASITAATHSWDGNLYWDLQTEPDGYYYFSTPEFNSTGGEYFGFYAPNSNAAIGEVAKRIAVQGKKLSWVMIPTDGNFNGDSVLKKLAREILPQRYNYRRGTYSIAYVRRGNYMFMFFDVRSMKN